MKRFFTFIIAIFTVLQIQAQTTVVDIIVNSPDHNTLEQAVLLAGLVDDLSGPGPFTVFAPTDAAIAAIPQDELQAILLDPSGALTDLLLFHVVQANIMSGDLSDGQTATTMLGEDVTVTINMDGVFINNAKVTVADIEADNGVVHVIDAVIMEPALPETVVDIVVNSPDHNTLEAAVIAAELADDLSSEGPFTVFAPTDAAFAALPEGALDALLADPTGDLANILLYHVVGGNIFSTDLVDGLTATTLLNEDVTVTINMDGIFINDAQVTVADIEAENGVVHVIDAVLIPDGTAGTVVDIIVNSPVHETLEAAVIAAELADDLSGEGPFTVFAPTDAAFAALPEGTLDALLADPTGDLANILLYHVVGGTVLSTDLSDGMMATTLLGEDVMVMINDDGVFINGAQVTVADVEADNGVVHVIDAVLLPPSQPATVVDIIVNSPDHETLEQAVLLAGLASELSGEGPFTVFAPTDAAINALPEAELQALLLDPTGSLRDLLLYHVVGAKVLSTDLSGGQTATTLLGDDITVSINADGIFINNAQVTVADIEADNGVVHVIDAVIMQPEPVTVVDIIVDSPDHEILEEAVIAAELADELSGEGPFTVFAPTDKAFEVLPEGTLETLLEDPTGDLANILLYHVLGAEVLSTDLSDGQTATTLLGQDIDVTINTDGVFINDAQVTVADIEADNGVVHVINAVLLPELVSVEEQAFSQSFQIAPNIVQEQFQVQFELTAPQNVQLEVYSINGQLVQQYDLGNLPTGSYQKELNFDTNTQGMYYLRATWNGNPVAIRPLVKAK